MKTIKRIAIYSLMALFVWVVPVSAATTIEDITKSTPEQVGYIIKTLDSGKYLAIQRDGNRVILTEEKEPGVGGLVKVFQFAYEVQLTTSLFHDEDEPSLAETIAYITSLMAERQANLAVDENTDKTVSLLYDLMKAFPDNQALVNSADRFSSATDRLSGKSSQLTASNQKLMRVVHASRLGLPIAVFEKYPDLYQFVVANGLDRQMAFFKNKIQLKGERGEQVPYLMVDGQYLPWSDVTKMVGVDKSGRMTDHVYTVDGLVAGAPDATLHIFNKESPAKHGGRYTVTLLGFKPNSVPHLWIQVRNPEGDVYSAGWMSTGSDYSSLWYYFSPDIHNGKVLSPDPVEVTSTDDASRVEVPIEITLAQYHSLMDLLTKYQQNPDACYSKAAQGEGGTADCAGFLLTVVEDIGIDVSAMPHDVYDVYRWLRKVAKNRQEHGGHGDPYGLPKPNGEAW